MEGSIVKKESMGLSFIRIFLHRGRKLTGEPILESVHEIQERDLESKTEKAGIQETIEGLLPEDSWLKEEILQSSEELQWIFAENIRRVENLESYSEDGIKTIIATELDLIKRERRVSGNGSFIDNKVSLGLLVGLLREAEILGYNNLKAKINREISEGQRNRKDSQRLCEECRKFFGNKILEAKFEMFGRLCCREYTEYQKALILRRILSMQGVKESTDISNPAKNITNKQLETMYALIIARNPDFRINKEMIQEAEELVCLA